MSVKDLLRKFGLIIITFLFCTSLSFLLLGYGFLELTEYDTLEPVMNDVISSSMTMGSTQTETQKALDALILQCGQPDKKTITIPLGSQEGGSLGDLNEVILNCDDVKTKNIDQLTSMISKQIFDKIYYKEYSEGNIIQKWNELSEEEKVWLLFSKYFHDFLSKNLKYVLILTIILGIFVIALSKEILTGIRNIGMSCVFVGIPFLFIGIMKKLVLAKVGEDGDMVAPFVDKLLSTLMGYFKIALILGIILVVISYIVKKLRKNKS